MFPTKRFQEDEKYFIANVLTDYMPKDSEAKLRTELEDLERILD